MMTHEERLAAKTEDRWASMNQIEEANRYAGQHFFDPDTMRFFKSRISAHVYYGRIFVTSEKGPDEIRRYTVRRQRRNGSMDTLGEFQGYATSRQAHKAAGTESAKLQLRDHLRKVTS